MVEILVSLEGVLTYSKVLTYILLVDEKPQVGIQLDQVEDDEDEADEASQPHALWNTTIERQVFDLLAAADMDGLCLHVSSFHSGI